MNKLIPLLCLSLLLSGCSASQGAAPKETSPPLEDINLQPLMYGEAGVNALSQVAVDLDIAALNETMAYGQVGYMMFEFTQYLGQSLRMQGIYQKYEMQTVNETYHYIMMVDETNCCQAALDFRLPEGVEYPPEGAEILVVGDYELYPFSFGDYPIIQVSSYAIVADPVPNQAYTQLP